MSRNAHDAIVVGAGPVGLVQALALARQGFATLLLHRDAPPDFDPASEVDRRVYALALDVVEALTGLGAWSEIAKHRHLAYREMVVWDAAGPGAIRFVAADYGWDALGVMVEHALLVAALWRRAQAEPGLSLRPLGAIEGLSLDADGVRLLVPELLRARVLLAADGADSRLRQALGLPAAIEDYGQFALVAHVRTEQPHRDTAWQRFLPGGPLAFLPLADGRSSIVWSLPSGQAERLAALDDDAFLTELGLAFEHRLGRCLAVSPRSTTPLRRVRVPRWVEGRAALVGDAAHVVHPLAGQGLNLGLRDALAYTEAALWGRRRGLDPGHRAVLRRYELERKSETWLADQTIHGLGALFRQQGPIAWLRGAALTAVDRLAPLKRLFATTAAGRRGRFYG